MSGVRVLLVLALILLSQVSYVSAQSLGAGTVRGTVTDASEAALPSTSIELSNPISGFSRHVQTNPEGSFVIEDVPLNTYNFRAHQAQLGWAF